MDTGVLTAMTLLFPTQIRVRKPLFLACLLCVSSAQAQEDIFELSLGDLLDLEVTSVSKKAQPVSQAAAAVFVITAEDIRRAGVTSIPEALRMAPGMEVAQVDGNKWAISARGSQGRFSNKLLVLMDGRTLYSPLFSGVFWDVQDTLLEDVQRIEVIRGPGATLWGANAVNGVINIITRSTRDTQGALFVAGAGDQERAYAGVRFGGEIGDAGDYRIYAKSFDRNGNSVADIGGDAADEWRQTRAGFRVDLSLAGGSDLSLQGDAYTGVSGTQSEDLLFTPPYVTSSVRDEEVSGYHLLANWRDSVGESDLLSVQAFVDRSQRDWDLIEIDRITFDLDTDYRIGRFDSHDILLGMDYRITRDDLNGGSRINVNPPRREEEVISAFVQDDWQLIPERLSVVAGLKLEKNDWTGYEHQPNLRVLWRPDESKSVWASVTRAVRTPGRAERDSFVLGAVIPPPLQGGLPTGVIAVGNKDFQAETLVAYEAGFKWEVNESLAWDIALYKSDYDRIRATGPIGADCFPQGQFPQCLFSPDTQALLALTQQQNEGQVEASGLEWAGTWQVTPQWQLKGAYWYIDESSTSGAGRAVIELDNRDPRHNASLRSVHQLRPNVDLDIWIRHVDEIGLARSVVDAYTTLDVRAAWRPRPNIELSLSGRNLVDANRVEFQSELGDVTRTAMQRSVHLQMSLTF